MYIPSQKASLIVVCWLFSLVSGSAYAGDKEPVIQVRDEVYLQAVTLTVTGEGSQKKVLAKGDAFLETGNLRLYAGELELDEVAGLVRASGGVTAHTTDDHFRGQSLIWNLDQRTAAIMGAELIAPEADLFIKAAQMWYMGAGHYRFKKAKFSTCTCNLPEPPAYMRAASMEVHMGGYARLTRPVIYVEQIPILASPWLFIPVKNERQTGLLFPRFGYSRREGFKFRPSLIVIPSEGTELYLQGVIASALGYGGEGAFSWVYKGARGRYAGSWMSEQFKTVYPAFSLGSWLDPAGSIAERTAAGMVAAPGSRSQRWTLDLDQEFFVSTWGRARLKSTLISDTRIYADYGTSLEDLTTDRVVTALEAVAVAPRGGAVVDVSIVSAVRSVDTTGIHRLPRLTLGWFPEIPVPALTFAVVGEWENNIVRVQPTEFPLAVSAFTRQGWSGQLDTGGAFVWQPARGIRLTLQGGARTVLHIPDSGFQKRLLDGRYPSLLSGIVPVDGYPGTASDVVPGVRPWGRLTAEVEWGRRYGEQKQLLHLVGLEHTSFADHYYGRRSAKPIWWTEQSYEAVAGVSLGLTNNLIYHDLRWDSRVFGNMVSTGTSVAADEVWPQPLAVHAESTLQNQYVNAVVHAAWRDDALRRVEVTAGLNPRIVGRTWSIYSGYSWQLDPWRALDPVWFDVGGTPYISPAGNRIGHDLYGGIQVPLTRWMTTLFDYRYSLGSGELVYWHSAAQLQSSCKCWQLQIGYSRLTYPGTDRFEFAFAMEGLGNARLE